METLREDIENDPSLAPVMEWIHLGRRITSKGFRRATMRFYHGKAETRLETRLENGFRDWLENHPSIREYINQEPDPGKLIKGARWLYLDSSLDYLQWNGLLTQTLAS